MASLILYMIMYVNLVTALDTVLLKNDNMQTTFSPVLQ